MSDQDVLLPKRFSYGSNILAKGQLDQLHTFHLLLIMIFSPKESIQAKHNFVQCSTNSPYYGWDTGNSIIPWSGSWSRSRSWSSSFWNTISKPVALHSSTSAVLVIEAFISSAASINAIGIQWTLLRSSTFFNAFTETGV